MSKRSTLLVAAIILLVLAFIYVTSLPAHAQSADVKALDSQVIAPTVMVTVGGDHVGSGTVVFSDRFQKDPTHVRTLILTNFHVIGTAVEMKETAPGFKQTEEVLVKSFNYVDTSDFVSASEMKAMVIGVDKEHDLALLALLQTAQQLPVARIAPIGARLDMGEEVIACGAGLGNVPYVSPTGRVGFNQVWMHDAYYTLVTTPITFGNSGGGLYRKAADGVWEMVGVPSDVSGSPEGAVWHVGFSIPMPMVYLFLDKVGMGWMANPDEYKAALVGAPEKKPSPATEKPKKKAESGADH